MAYKELEVGELTEIDSVSSFISAVKALKESDDGTSTELYFAGRMQNFGILSRAYLETICLV